MHSNCPCRQAQGRMGEAGQRGGKAVACPGAFDARPNSPVIHSWGVRDHPGTQPVTSSAPNQGARQHPSAFSSSYSPLDRPEEGNYISPGWPSAGKQAPTGLVLGGKMKIACGMG
ncbi:hypothetical protein KUCAC02_008031 [Chaenocephalus aceratus]|uniref:Uncharacterized protein n=1 Tax=Chaenocephalus aceratus TaxID=36190 RepID=A0ACB9X7B4_CHAAC|nr:hypothetical protein KUCAC02_008031 [Chaenocephalus aceratus]